MPPPGEATGGEQYFVERPTTRSERRELRFLYRGELLTVEVDRSVFASHGLDPGTALLIESMVVGTKDRVLDLGCGWGAIGLAAAKSALRGRVVLTDSNRRAVYLARHNLARNKLENAEVKQGSVFRPVGADRFDLIATNPPYHAGRPVVLQILREAPQHLNPGGRLLLVGKGSQGILYYQKWLQENWSGRIDVVDRRSGYRVLEATLGPAGTAA